MSVYILGAGSSRGTFGKLIVPTAAEFGKTLHDINGNWAKEHPALKQVVEHLGLPLNDWALEPVWTCIDYYAKLNSVLPKTPWPEASPQMKKALLNVYGERCDKATDNLPTNNTYTLGCILPGLQNGDTLVSFNYDTIAERLAAKFGHTLQPLDRQNSQSGISFIKPHGSTSWTLDLNSRPRTVTSVSGKGEVLSDSLTSSDVDAGREPLLLGTVPIKSELIKEVQQRCNSQGVYKTITDHWRAFVNAIINTERIVVVGYSFPKEDQYGRFLLQEAVRKRVEERKQPLTIEYYELPDRAPQCAQEIMDAFHSHVETLSYKGAVKPGD